MQPIKPLVVLGHGLWQELACALLSAQLQPYGWQVIAVISAVEEPEPASLICDPELTSWGRLLQWPHSKLLIAGRGRVSLGHRYQDGTKNWFVPYGYYGLQQDASEFSQALLAFLAGAGAKLSADDFSVAAQASTQHKFAFAPANRPDLVHALSYGLQLESAPLAQWLRQQNQQAGVRYIQSQQIQLLRDANDSIYAVQLDQQLQELSFCIDCRRPPAPAQSPLWLSARDPVTSAAPCASAIRTDWGWLVQHQLANCSYWHTLCDTDQHPMAAMQQQLAKLTGVSEWQSIAVSSDTTIDQPWQHNWLQCGAAAASLDHPLFSGLMAQQFLLLQWLELLPSQATTPATAALYNQHWQQYQADVRCFLQCHQDPLATAQGRLFNRLGRLLPAETSAIQPAQWFGLLYGLGLRPELPSMLLAKRSETTISTALQQVQQSIAKLVSGMPGHSDLLLRQQDSTRGM